jgi:hypothetical protein
MLNVLAGKKVIGVNSSHAWLLAAQEKATSHTQNATLRRARSAEEKSPRPLELGLKLDLELDVRIISDRQPPRPFLPSGVTSTRR